MYTTPRKNVEIYTDEDDMKCFRSTCSCGDDDHDLTVYIDHNLVELEFKMIDHDDYSANIFVRFLKRIALAMKILFTGRHETYGEFIFKDPNTSKTLLKRLKKLTLKLQNNNNNDPR